MAYVTTGYRSGTMRARFGRLFAGLGGALIAYAEHRSRRAQISS